MTKKIEYKDYFEYKDYIQLRLNDKLHQKDDLFMEYDDGSKAWYLNSKYHRDDGPAIEWTDGSKEWWLNGARHREDGPAIEKANGTKKWYFSGHYINDIKLYLTKRFDNCIGHFLYKKYLIFCFEKNNYYFYMVLWKTVNMSLWKDNIIKGKKYDCSLEKLKSVL